MYSYVLSYSVQTGEGIVSGDDGNRYAFTGRDWLDAEPPARNDRVVFDAWDGQATGVFVTAPSHRSEFASPRPPAAPAVAAGCGVGCFTWFAVFLVFSIINAAIGIWSDQFDSIWTYWDRSVALWTGLAAGVLVGYLVYRAVRYRRR